LLKKLIAYNYFQFLFGFLRNRLFTFCANQEEEEENAEEKLVSN